MVSCQRLSYFRVFAFSVPSQWDVLPKGIYPHRSFSPLFPVFTQMPFNQAGLSWPTSLAILILLILLYFLPSTVTIWHSTHSLVYLFVCFSLLKCKSHKIQAFVLFTTEFLVTASVLEHGGRTLIIAGWTTKWVYGWIWQRLPTRGWNLSAYVWKIKGYNTRCCCQDEQLSDLWTFLCY